ncbi:hypothetical protein [Halobacillus andaensis]|nr:hypothetical protein [Halobacillus andaensis]MBP2005517.1 hypothetical protein [Halobacillus andaensis]
MLQKREEVETYLNQGVRRNVHAIGEMEAQIPVNGDSAKNE